MMIAIFIKYSYGFIVNSVKDTLCIYIIVFIMFVRFSNGREDNAQKLICMTFVFVFWRNFKTTHKIQNGNQTRSKDFKSFLAQTKLYSVCFIKLLTKPIN